MLSVVPDHQEIGCEERVRNDLFLCRVGRETLLLSASTVCAISVAWVQSAHPCNCSDDDDDVGQTDSDSSHATDKSFLLLLLLVLYFS